MGNVQEVIERLLRPLRDTLETRDKDELSWSRVRVTLRMDLWWLNVRDEEKGKKKKSRFKKLMKLGKRNEVDVETAGLSEIEREWRHADGLFQLLRNNESQNESGVECPPESSTEPSEFKIVSNGNVKIFRSQDIRVAKKWKQAIELRLMSWENLLKIDPEKFKALLLAHSESTPSETTEGRKVAGNEEIGRRKIAGMHCSGFMLKELHAALNVGVDVGRNLRIAPNKLDTATDVINFLSAAPYVGYAFRIVGLGLELAMRLAKENEALQEAERQLKKIVKTVLRALTFAMKSGDRVGFYDFLKVMEECETIGRELEFYGFRSTTKKVKNAALGKTVQPTKIISRLEKLHDHLTQELTLNSYRVSRGSTKASLVRQESSGLSRNVSAAAPWPEEISVSDGGSYVGNKRLLDQISEDLAKGKMEKGSPKNAMRVQKCIISSPGGMGKTELVKQYARSKREFYKGGVYWVEAEKEGSLLKSFQVIREQVRAFVSSDIETWSENGECARCVESECHNQLKADCRKLFRRLGQEKGAWLLIFDNADEIKGDKDFRLQWIPQIGFGNVLLTTSLHARHHNLNSFATARNPTHVTGSLEKLGVDDARSLLLFHAGERNGKPSKEENDCIKKIVGPKNLDGHPLAIVQAGLYLRETSMPLERYVEFLDRFDAPEVIVSDEDGEEEEKKSILKTFLPSKKELCNAAKELLSILCWLPPDGIAERDLWNSADPSMNAFYNSSLQKYFGEGEKNPCDPNGFLKEKKGVKLVGEVCKYGLIQRVCKGKEVVIRAHRLVYAVERDSLKNPQDEIRLRSAIVTAIMLLQHHLKMRKNKSKPIALSNFHEKHKYSESWSIAKLHRALGYFLEMYNTYGHGEVFRFYQYAADLEDATAIFNLGNMYSEGVGVEKNEKRAAELYGKAAELGDADAMHNLAFLYRKGRGVKKDEKRAAELYGKAAELGDADSMYNLGVRYYSGRGMAKNEKRAADLFGKAAKLGNARAMYVLGILHSNGRGVEKDEKRAVELYGQAADLGVVGAMYNLGLLYRNGVGVEKDDMRAAELYGKAAELGDADAMCNLGFLYLNGIGVEKDEKRAAELYGKAAELEDAHAMYNLGILYEDGKGVEKDEKRAAELYSRAVELGNGLAMNNLGYLYEKGRGVKKDEKRAAELLRKARSLGSLHRDVKLNPRKKHPPLKV